MTCGRKADEPGGYGLESNSEGIVRATSAIMETRSNNTVRENATNLQGTPYTAVGGV